MRCRNRCRLQIMHRLIFNPLRWWDSRILIINCYHSKWPLKFSRKVWATNSLSCPIFFNRRDSFKLNLRLRSKFRRKRWRLSNNWTIKARINPNLLFSSRRVTFSVNLPNRKVIVSIREISKRMSSSNQSCNRTIEFHQRSMKSGIISNVRVPQCLHRGALTVGVRNRYKEKNSEWSPYHLQSTFPESPKMSFLYHVCPNLSRSSYES